jgi:integrase
VTHPATAAHRPHPDDEPPPGWLDRLVLSGRPLRPGHWLERTSRFGQDVWDVTPAIFQQHARAVVLNFSPFPPACRAAVKELCYIMLSGQLPPNESRPKVLSIRRHLVELKRFTRWLDSRPQRPGRPLRELTTDDLTAYAVHLDGVLGRGASREVAEVAVRLLWRYRTVLTTDRLTVDPLDADGWGNSTRRRAENTTARIPEHVMGPLLTWCLRFIDDFAPDIIAARAHWYDHRQKSRLSRLARTAVQAQLRAKLDSYRRSGQPLPGHDGKVNYSALAAEIGCTAITLRLAANKEHIDAVAARNGTTASPPVPTPITGQLDGQPWLPHIGSAVTDPNGAVPLAILLQTACYITIAYLSGMRDSEIKHLRRNCVRTHYDSAGTPYRWTVTGLAFKGETDPAGTTASWVIGAAAARAVAVLERLQPQTVDALFRTVAGNVPEHQPTGTQHVGRTNQLLNQFTAWVNTYCHDRGRTDTIPPMPHGQRLQTRQFRRTLAWHIARRPGGAIAGALQYRHLSIQMFEGYAGTSESGFRAEVEAEQALARGEHLLAMTTGHDHPDLTGPAAAEATRRIADFAAGLTQPSTNPTDRRRDGAGFAGTVVTDPARLKRLMQRRDPHIYPGTYSTCVFDPAKAMCQPQPDGRGITRPVQASCQPLDCRNIALTPDNWTALRAEADRIAVQLGQRPALPPLLLHRLTARHGKITTFLARHDPAEAP